MKTTLNKIRKHHTYDAIDWEKLLKHLDKTQADDEPLKITTIIDSNGLQDAIWCLSAVDGHDSEIRLFAVWCARQVQHLMNDQRSVNALNVAERFANGLASSEDLDDAIAYSFGAIHDHVIQFGTNDYTQYAVNCCAWYATRGSAYEAAIYAAQLKISNEISTLVAQEAELRRICAEIESAEVIA